MHKSEEALLKTLIYSDIFDYPLTKSQLWRYSITPEKITFASFVHVLETSTYIQEQDGFYFLKKRSILPTIRKKREKESKKKLEKAQRILRFLAKIPTIECIGISGSLAMKNAEKNADIDLYVLTTEGTLWTTRILILFLLEIVNMRRKRRDAKARDKICVNMLVDMSHVKFPHSRHDLYTAHEIVQMQIMFSRHNAYAQFLEANMWVKKYMPNSLPSGIGKKREKQRISFSLFRLFEPLARFVQQTHMKNYITTETITNNFVAFHPADYKRTILTEFEKRKKAYGI